MKILIDAEKGSVKIHGNIPASILRGILNGIPNIENWVIQTVHRQEEKKSGYTYVIDGDNIAKA